MIRISRYLLIAIFGIASTALIAQSKPNIILFLADDMGYGDPQCYNSGSPIPTPNMDRLASEGMIFTDAHTASSVCTPTRYSILTGRYAWRTWLKRGVLWMYDKPLISVDRLTLPKMLQLQGYATACIGKWHLGMDWPTVDGSTVGNYIGEKNVDSIGVSFGKKIDYNRPIKNGPTSRGFDYYYGTDVPNFPPYCFIENDRTVGIPGIEKPDNMFGRPGPMIPGWKLEKILPALGDKAVEYIEEQANKKDPFFLYFACTAPHTPIIPDKQFVGKAKAGPYGDFVHQVDWTLGQIMKTLVKKGIAENTIVIFTSDNGSATRAGDPYVHGEEYGKRQAVVKLYGHNPSYIYRGFKWSIYEGGHRVPFIVRWPGKVKKGSSSDQIICTTDLIATIASITGFELPENSAEDSYSIVTLLTGESNKVIRETVINHSSGGMFSVRKGKWKLIEKDKGSDYELFDLDSDPGEKNNVSQQHPEVVQNMSDLLNKNRDDGRSLK